MVRYVSTMILVAVATSPMPTEAQAPGGRTVPIKWEIWGGLAQNSPGTLWGAEQGRDIAVVAVRAAMVMASSPSVRVEYVVDLVPGAWVSMPRPASRCGPLPKGERCPLYHAFEGSHAVWGAGVAPVGIRAEFRRVPWAQPYLAASTGLLHFSRPVPLDDGGRMNFTVDVGGGLLFALPARLRAVAGYKFYHISNGGTALKNPGLDGHMVVIGLQGAR